MPGTLVPSWYSFPTPTGDEFAAASVAWGISLGLSAMGFIRAGWQTQAQWRRTRRVTAYMVFIWLELLSSTIIGGTSWAFMKGNIEPSVWYFAGTIFLWFFQTHCILQIIINRIGLIAVDKIFIKRLKWAVFVLVCLINIAVACIWIPTRLQISQTYMRINSYWDRTEKILLGAIDVALNGYFIYLVRSSLLSYGLRRYVPLFYFNLVMIGVSVCMDILLISLLSVPNPFLYVCFHPLAYLVKLHIELSMADLIAKIVKGSGQRGHCSCSCHGNQNLNVPRDDILNPTPTSDQARPQTPNRFRQWISLQNYRPQPRNLDSEDVAHSTGGPEQRDELEEVIHEEVVVRRKSVSPRKPQDTSGSGSTCEDLEAARGTPRVVSVHQHST